mmetsp:Transcript_56729/g.127712  ORF Transcript_56729/g.127712 Transcript_56729/m.127712 type:complete len:342 (+) Transcript_56729:1150-2175(+)
MQEEDLPLRYFGALPHAGHGRQVRGAVAQDEHPTFHCHDCTEVLLKPHPLLHWLSEPMLREVEVQLLVGADLLRNEMLPEAQRSVCAEGDGFGLGVAGVPVPDWQGVGPPDRLLGQALHEGVVELAVRRGPGQDILGLARASLALGLSTGLETPFCGAQELLLQILIAEAPEPVCIQISVHHETQEECPAAGGAWHAHRCPSMLRVQEGRHAILLRHQGILVPIVMAAALEHVDFHEDVAPLGAAVVDFHRPAERLGDRVTVVLVRLHRQQARALLVCMSRFEAAVPPEEHLRKGGQHGRVAVTAVKPLHLLAAPLYEDVLHDMLRRLRRQEVRAGVDLLG